MAFKCLNCHRVHPEGAVTCKQAREMIAQRVEEIKHKMSHHKEDHPGCPDSNTHVVSNEALAKAQARAKFMHMRF